MSEAYFQRIESRLIKIEAQLGELHRENMKSQSNEQLAGVGALVISMLLGVMMFMRLVSLFKGE